MSCTFQYKFALFATIILFFISLRVYLSRIEDYSSRGWHNCGNFLLLSPCVCLNFCWLWLGLELGFPINWGPLFWLPHMVILSHGIDLPCIGHCLQLEFMLTSLMHILHDMLTRFYVHLGDVDRNTIRGYNVGRWMNNTPCKSHLPVVETKRGCI